VNDRTIILKIVR